MSDDLEDASQREIRLRASAAGLLLWRNNSGVAQTVDRYGKARPVRYGLANDSPAVNRVLKSSDLIGIAPDGRFVAIESKRPGWRYAGTAREQAQLAFINTIQQKGGLACFATGWEDVVRYLNAASTRK